MENWNVNQTYNCGSICDPFLTPFANAHAFSVNFKSTYNGSLTSYFALTMAQHNVPDRECSPNPNPAPTEPPYCPQSSQNIVDNIEKGGLSWKVYAEDYPTSCGNKCSPGNCYIGYYADSLIGSYAGSHNSFVYYTDIVSSSDRCSKIVPANSVVDPSGPENDTALLNDLSSTSTAPNFMWLLPNECDQMHHDCGWGVSPVTQGSRYLAKMLPQILNSWIFQNQRAALFITFDECQNPITNTCDSTNRIYTLWASASASVVRPNFKSNLPHNHYSFLHTLEWAWNLPPLTNNDGTATIMREFFA
jgi:hypothetical protein